MLAPQEWRCPPVQLKLFPGETHVWRASLTPDSLHLEALYLTLSADEQARANRTITQVRRRLIAARGLLREILGSYLGIPAGDVRFTYGPHGKPALAGNADLPLLQFNLAHSADLALYAFSLNHEVGIDIEHRRVNFDVLALAKHFFSPREASELANLPEAQHHEAFYTAWTRKEAYLKALGRGIGYGLESFSVSLRPGDAAALLDDTAQPDAPSRWRIITLDPAPGYAAALAIDAHNGSLRCWNRNCVDTPGLISGMAAWGRVSRRIG